MRYAYTRAGSFEVAKCRMEMLSRGLTSRDLARAARVNLRYLENLLSGVRVGWPLKAALNKFFKIIIFNPDPARLRGKLRRAKNKSSAT